MALIDRRGQVIADGWSYPDSDPALHSARLVFRVDALSSGSAANPLGVLIQNESELELILPYLDGLVLIVVAFPKFRDGRGFTIARALRERYRYAGDVRAIGHVLPDQFAFLVQCGFSSIVTPFEHPPEQWAHEWRRQSVGPGQLLHRMLGRGALNDEAEPVQDAPLESCL